MKIKDKIKSIFRNGAQECVALNYIYIYILW